MRGHSDLACRRLCADYFACLLKGLNDLHAEVNDHRCFAMRRVVVKKAIMTVGSQAFMAAEKLPDKIKRRLPCFPNVPNAHVTPYCGERLRADGLSDNLILPQRLPLHLFKFGQRKLSNVRVDAAARIHSIRNSEFAIRNSVLLPLASNDFLDVSNIQNILRQITETLQSLRT